MNLIKDIAGDQVSYVLTILKEHYLVNNFKLLLY